MKPIRLMAIIICVLILSSCNVSKKPDNPKEGVNITPPVTEPAKEPEKEKEPEKDKEPEKEKEPEEKEPEKENVKLTAPDLKTEEGIKEYLSGKWIFEKENTSQISCNMNIDRDLNVELSFKNIKTSESIGEHSGYITLDRQYAEEDEPPDLLLIELTGDYPGGYYFFLHRTLYDEKYVMSLVYAANGDGIFDLLEVVNAPYNAREEILFEKQVGEKSQLKPHKDKEFHAVLWGEDEKNGGFWLDDVEWTPIEEYDPDPAYPDAMILYENDIAESILYHASKDMPEGTLAIGLYPGTVYYVKTDKDGNILIIEDAEHNSYMDELNDKP